MSINLSAGAHQFFHPCLTIAPALLSFWKLKNNAGSFLLLYSPASFPSLHSYSDFYEILMRNMAEILCKCLVFLDMLIFKLALLMCVEALIITAFGVLQCISSGPLSRKHAHTSLAFSCKNALFGRNYFSLPFPGVKMTRKQRELRKDREVLGGDTYPLLVTTCTCLPYVREELLCLSLSFLFSPSLSLSN